MPALVFVVPAMLGTVVGGFWSGAVGAVAGFLVYDWFFLPPYDTFTVRSPQNWIALAVYAAVVLVVAQVVSQLQRLRRGGGPPDRRGEAPLRAVAGADRGPAPLRSC